MNLILLENEDFVKGSSRVRLKGRRFKHVKEILGSAEGDDLRVGLVNNRIGSGKIVSRASSFIEMDVAFKTEPPPALRVILVLALPRPIVLNRLLSSVATMGVKRVYLIHSKHVEKTYWQSRVVDGDNIKQQLILGLEQAGDTFLPELFLRKRFRPFVEDELPGIIKGTTPLLAYPEGDKPDIKIFKRAATVVIGPERGFIPYEIKKFTDIGFSLISMGPRVLRVETAVAAFLGKFLQ